MIKIASVTVFIACLTIPAISQNDFPHFKISKDLDVIRISPNSYVHMSFAELPGYGRVEANGLIYVVDGEALLLDTPWNDSLTKRLVNWITDSLKARVVAFVPNHWHDDCMGGLNYLNMAGIRSYACEKTIAIAKLKNLPVPQYSFVDSLTLHVGNRTILCRYYGPAHSIDNIVTWIPSEGILFGGCMVKDLNSESLGNTTDANLIEWPNTINRVIAAYSSAKVVIPGHGAFGGPELLNHTRDLLMKTKQGSP